MKRIALALFAIAGVVAAGYFATSAYFTDTASMNNLTFETGTADLKFAPCPGIATDCSTTPATLDSYTFSTSSLVGPGITNTQCVVIENTGDYLLHLTSKLVITSAVPVGMQNAVTVKAESTDTSCNPGSGTPLYSTQSAASAQAAGDVSIGDLAAGGRMYVLLTNGWDSTGNQDGLQNGQLKLNVSVTGQTD